MRSIRCLIYGHDWRSVFSPFGGQPSYWLRCYHCHKEVTG